MAEHDTNQAQNNSMMTTPAMSPQTVDGWLEALKGTSLPYLVEITLSWVITVAFSIRYVLGYAFLLVRMRYLRSHPERWHQHVSLASVAHTTASRSEGRSALAQQLIEAISKLRPGNSEPSDDDIVNLFQSNLELRQLASRLMLRVQRPTSSFEDSPGRITNNEPQHNQHQSTKNTSIEAEDLVLRLQRLWPRLMQMPPPTDHNADTPSHSAKVINDEYSISVIIPAFRESAEDINRTLAIAKHRCSRPQSIQIIIAHAGGCADLHQVMQAERDGNRLSVSDDGTTIPNWGDLQLIRHSTGGGRGRCMNTGATHARGRVITFFHADTIPPRNWDSSILSALGFANNNNNNNSSSSSSIKEVSPSHPRPTCCAFLQDIDASDHALKGGGCPPGIIPVSEILCYLRCRLCKLPYGDSLLSFPANIFHFLGGFPDQPLMEDFEIISQLRIRSLLLNERIVIIPGRACCSVRRWQKFGVPYTILVNALCVHRYITGTTADELFQFYYGRNQDGKQQKQQQQQMKKTD